jgi:protein-S-isoprenylcysteine O-methyltransferase Ste14
MNSWFGKALVLFGIVSTIVIRAPHGKRHGKIKIVESRRGALEIGLLAFMWITMLILPILAIFTPIFSLADYRLYPIPFSIGLVCLMAGLWLFYRSHADLGESWSLSLEILEGHKLVTHGVYKRIRHPMYTANFLQAVAQMLLLPNWIAGPSCFVAFLLLFMFRVCAEERMMSEKFGEEYARYKSETKRLVPYFW